MAVRLSLSQISTINASFAADVAAYSRAGFDAIGIWEFKLPEDDRENMNALASAGLAVANCVPAVPSILQLKIPGLEGPADPEKRIESICASVARLAKYGPESILCLTGPRGELSLDEATARVTDGLHRIARTARAAGVRVGLEPMHPSQSQSGSFLTSLADAITFLDAAGLDDIGIMLDTSHVWDDAGAEGWIAVHVDRITGVHVCDRPPGEGRTDRALPGTLGPRTATLVRAARAAGWDGSLDVEIFSEPDQFWALPVDEAALRAHAAAASLMAASAP
jgi:sugar phosphate isomerase/epimerase